MIGLVLRKRKKCSLVGLCSCGLEFFCLPSWALAHPYQKTKIKKNKDKKQMLKSSLAWDRHYS